MPMIGHWKQTEKRCTTMAIGIEIALSRVSNTTMHINHSQFRVMKQRMISFLQKMSHFIEGLFYIFIWLLLLLLVDTYWQR